MNVRPAQDRKKGASSGIDGVISFLDDNSGKAKRIIGQVKSGHVNRIQIATLKGDMERESAQLGLFLTLEPPTRPMLQEAVAAGFYVPDHYPDRQYPRVQTLTIEELLAGKKAQYFDSGLHDTFRPPPAARGSRGRRWVFSGQLARYC